MMNAELRTDSWNPFRIHHSTFRIDIDGQVRLPTSGRPAAPRDRGAGEAARVRHGGGGQGRGAGGAEESGRIGATGAGGPAGEPPDGLARPVVPGGTPAVHA